MSELCEQMYEFKYYQYLQIELISLQYCYVIWV